MRLVTTPRVAFLREVADEFLSRTGRGRVIVAIDGPLRSGKTQLGDDLADVLRERGLAVFRASVEDFHRSREAQAEYGPDTPERYWRYGIDESLLERTLVAPFRMAGSTAFVTRGFDLARDAWVEPKWRTGPADAILVLDGRFLLRERLRERWDVELAVDGDPVDPADRLAYASSDPRAVASIVVDLADPAHPRRAPDGSGGDDDGPAEEAWADAAAERPDAD
ncbi:uridine kinase [Agromyces sp. SYSU T0242]|uniref:uridine kinase n=1 Tax=Agromyces litoreus TaxID=3158561 RepID=UPI00339B3574